MTDFDAVDFFRARPLYQDPYPYYEYLRAHGPVWREPHHGVVMVTGYDEAIAVLNDTDDVLELQHRGRPVRHGSRCPLEGDDISDDHRASTATSSRSATSSLRSTHRSTPRTARC